MSTTWIVCDIDGKSEDQVTETLADDGTVTGQLVQTWVVVTDGNTKSDPVDALSAGVSGGKTLPASGSFIGNYTVSQRLPKRTGPFSFSVQITAKYKFTPPPPTAKFAVQILFSGQQYIEDAHSDMNNVAILTSAKHPYTPSLPGVHYDERIQVSYQTTSDQSANFKTVRGKVNGSAISFNIQGVSRSFAIRELKCEDVVQTASLPLAAVTTGGVTTVPPVFKVTASFTGRADTYITKVLDQDFKDINNTLILDANGAKPTTPQMLDGSGNALAQSATPMWLTFKMESEADFTSVFSGLA